MNKFRLDEAISITQKDIKDLSGYSNDIKECKKVKVTIIKKNGTKVPITFSNELLYDFLKKGFVISFKSMCEEAAETEKELLRIKRKKC
ncbi:hypothetical protein I4P50_16135 [Clostridioides difficile]|uniref:hypothetical protein n=1 Tax=Clostridioides difficile TaxID=1496 RepID=UPI000BB1DE32|nr:hypothetical protein [Clostridioides difficile]EGT3674383.1 hypothetical protein [Clostridioides difficile]EGT5403867.1 hypothetical protein [Clostridioides difficile]EGT5546379.1 hypothetical protein [Clostridioides difficile]EJA6791043.1 hypothetical protein [Clostridioides difficile]EJA6846159.1 hypothetical protein [Clostridioides difficile]